MAINNTSVGISKFRCINYTKWHLGVWSESNLSSCWTGNTLGNSHGENIYLKINRRECRWSADHNHLLGCKRCVECFPASLYHRIGNPQDREPEYRWKGIKTDFHKTNKFVSNSPKSPYYNNQLSGLTFTQIILKQNA